MSIARIAVELGWRWRGSWWRDCLCQRELCQRSLPFLQGLCLITEEEFFILINVSIPGVWFCFTWPLRNQSFKAGRTLKHHLSNPLYDNREIEIWGRWGGSRPLCQGCWVAELGLRAHLLRPHFPWCQLPYDIGGDTFLRGVPRKPGTW